MIGERSSTSSSSQTSTATLAVASSSASDWTRAPAAIAACVLLGFLCIAGLLRSWNRADVARQGQALVQTIEAATDWEPTQGFAPTPAPEPMRVLRLINVNTADSAQLELLPRIGPALAAEIIANRQEHGPFMTIEALDRVKGIGPKTIEKIRSRVILSDSNTDPAPTP